MILLTGTQFIYICLYEHIYTHIHMYMYIYVCSYKYTCVHIYKKNMCVHGTGRYSIYIIYIERESICISVHIHTCIDKYMCAYKYKIDR